MCADALLYTQDVTVKSHNNKSLNSLKNIAKKSDSG